MREENMRTTPAVPNHPTPELVSQYVQKFNNENRAVELALSTLIQTFPNNTARDEVYVKVVTLNGLYNTRI